VINFAQVRKVKKVKENERVTGSKCESEPDKVAQQNAQGLVLAILLAPHKDVTRRCEQQRWQFIVLG
jgi:hypothetical protein